MRIIGAFRSRVISRRTEARPADPDILLSPVEHMRMRADRLPSTRLRWLWVVGAMVLLGLAVRSGQLQITGTYAYRSQAEGNRVRLVVEYAPRGIVLDRAGTPLVRNVPSSDLVTYPAQLPADSEELIRVLHDIFPAVQSTEFQQRLSGLDPQSLKPVPLLSDIPHAELINVLARSAELPGIGVENRALRQYEGEGEFAHVLGYTGKITQEEHAKRPYYLLTESLGKAGIERQYEERLRGTHGARRVEVDVSGTVQKELSAIPSRPGLNLRLHIDAELQRHLVDALSRHVTKAGGARAAAVALDPRTGGVRALVSIPTYDSSRLAKGLSPEEAKTILMGSDHPLLDRVVQGQYAPGSTFKLAVAVGALEEGVVNGATTVDSTGGIRVGPWFFPDWKPGGHGTTNLTKAIAESVNTYFYRAGGGVGDAPGLGIERLTKWAAAVGFGRPTGIDLPGEERGFLPSPEWKRSVKHEEWYIGDTYHAAIGQGDILVTPLQLAVATAAVANGGTVFEPRVADAFVRTDGSVVERIMPVPRATHVFQEATGARVREGMRAAVLSGSARALADVPVAIAGKTGSAQVAGKEKTHAWFTSFAPYDNPELVLVIMAEEAGAGDAVAVPVAEDVYRWYAGDHSEHPPTEPSQPPGDRGL
jgi:penicillin-binding protein 2